jgi:arabinoxylan arabinofuranohydrolase
MKHILIICILLGFAVATVAQKKNVNTKPYPYGNPVIHHMYTADAAPKVMPDGRLWMVTSIDHEDGGGYSTMHAINAYSTSDMVNWTDHGEILGIDDFDVPEGEDWAIWAPDIIYRNGIYYLYFPMRNILADGTIDRYVAVAESDRMDMRFTITNPRMKGVERAGLDPSVFIDDNGQAYFYWNQAFMGLLKDDMREIDGQMFKIDYGSDNFMEAAWMHKRNGIYYYNYHTKYDGKIDINNPDDPNRPKSELHYSMGNSPRGPLVHKGVINYELGVNVKNGPKMPGYDFVPWRMTQSNHGAVVEYHGQEYFFYHTSALSSWRQDEFKGPGTWTQRSVCVDYLNYNPDGTAIPVQQTIEGVAKIQINQPFAINLDCKKAKRSKNTSLENNAFSVTGEGIISYKKINMGTGYYYFEADIEKGAENARIEIRKGSPDGLLMGTLLINNESTLKNFGKSQTFLREANGTHDIYLVIKAEENETVKFSNLRFFAGSPKLIKQDVE